MKQSRTVSELTAAASNNGVPANEKEKPKVDINDVYEFDTRCNLDLNAVKKVAIRGVKVSDNPEREVN